MPMLLLPLLLIAIAAFQLPSCAQAEGKVYVADQTGGTIRQYSTSGADLGVFASGLTSPSWMTADSDGNIYVSEYSGGRVTKFSPLGAVLLTITTPYAAGAVRVGSDGTIFVGDYFGDGVYRYSATGQELGLFVTVPGLDPDFIAFDGGGYLYVTEFCCHGGRVRRISPTGVDLGDFVTGIPGIEGIAFDGSGNLYAALGNTALGTIKKYSASGADLGTFASTGLNDPYGLAFDRGGNLYVANYGNGTIRKFSPSGTDLGVFASVGLVNPRDLVIVEDPVVAEPCDKTLDFSESQYSECFRDVRFAGNVNSGSDLGGTGHSALNFTGSAAAAGNTWLTVYDRTPDDSDQTILAGSVHLSADVLIHRYNNKKGAGVVALYNEEVGKKGLALILYDAGNTATLALVTVNQAGKLTTLKSVAMGAAIVEDAWYRLTMDVVIGTSPQLSVTGKVFKHMTPGDPNSPLGGQVRGTLSFSGPRPVGVEDSGEVGIVASAYSATVDSSVTNFAVVQ